jgi:dihydrofolate synthase/folylpolyglutamate synthase
MGEPYDGPIDTASDAARWLEGLINVEKQPQRSFDRFSLAPIEALLDRLGHPERIERVVHIAGSKGKGSTALLVEALLQGAGLRVGTFTSPHLERWTERFRVEGREVESERLAAATRRVRPHVEALRGDPARSPTFFDATTALAWCLFEEAGVDAAVMEVGLGGRLDSTNAVSPTVTCITSIELEHTDRLGHSLAEIAGEKAGIVKDAVPVVVGRLADDAMQVVESQARKHSAPLARLDREIRLEAEDLGMAGWRLLIEDGPLRVAGALPLLGVHQPTIAALAVACARRVLGTALDVDAFGASAAATLAGASLPGRIEVLSRDPWILVDAAHTAASCAALVDVLEKLARPVHLVVSISSDKDFERLLGLLVPRAARLTVTRADSVRSVDPLRLAAVARGLDARMPVEVEPDAARAVARAVRDRAAEEAVCVAGSVYLAGIALRVLSTRATRSGSTSAGGPRSPIAGA